MTMLVEPVPVIPAAEGMSDDIFIRHMNLRHSDSLGGLVSLPFTMNPYVLKCYRIFHDRLHRVRIDLNHEHTE